VEQLELDPAPQLVQARVTVRRKVHSLAAERERRLALYTTFCANSRRRSMHIGSSQAAGLAVMLMTLTSTAWGQDKPACDPKGNIKTPELVAGQVSKLDRSQGKLTVRDGGGKEYEFLASNETLQDINIGDPIKAKLREAPKCPEK
jgi:hypothetical protein